MTTAAYRDILTRQRSDTLRREDGYPLSEAQIAVMVARYAAKRERPLAKAGAADQRRFVNRLARSERRLSRIFARELAKLFNQMGREAAKVYRQQADMVVKQDDPTPEEENIVEYILHALNLGLWQQDTFVPTYESMVERIAIATVGDIEATFRLGINMPDWVMRRIVADGGTRAGLLDIAEETRKALFRALYDGRVNGEGADALARRIYQYVPEGRYWNAGARYRTRMIARTETKYAQNESSIQAYENSDVVTGLRIFDAQLGDTDADCEALNGRIVSFAEARQIGMLDHPNCTRSFAPVTS